MKAREQIEAQLERTRFALHNVLLPNDSSPRSGAGAEIKSKVLSERQQNAASAQSPTEPSRIEQLIEQRESALDRTLAETFPCSDPLSSIPDPVSHPF